MNSDLLNLPDDAAALKQIIALHLNKEEKYQERIDYLEQMVCLLQKELFGRKSKNMSCRIMSNGRCLIP